LLAAAASAAAWLVATPSGSAFLVSRLAERYARDADVRIAWIGGRLGGRLTARGVEIRNLKKLPPGSVLYVGRLEFRAFRGKTPAFDVRAEGVRLRSSAVPGGVVVRLVEGSLKERLVISDVGVRGLLALPYGSRLRAQRLTIRAPFRTSSIESFENVRIETPSSDPVLAFGALRNRSLDASVYARKIDVREVVERYLKKASFRNARGAIRELNVKIDGPPLSPRIRGTARLVQGRYRMVRILHAVGSFTFSPKKTAGKWRVPGELVISRGKLRVLRTSLKIVRGRVTFLGDGRLPRFDLEGASKIGDVRITVYLRGDADRPDLKVASDPPLPEETILVMLATGKEWQGVGKAIREGKISVGIAKDFLDFFLFGGSGGGFSERFGIKEVSVQYDENVRGVEVKKGLLKQVDALYAVEQPQGQEAAAPATHKVGAEYRLNDDSLVSAQVKKKMESPDETGKAADEPIGNESVTVEYRQKF